MIEIVSVLAVAAALAAVALAAREPAETHEPDAIPVRVEDERR